MKFSHFLILSLASFAAFFVVGCAGKPKDVNPGELAAQTAETQAEFQHLIAKVIVDPSRAKEFSDLSAQKDQLIRKNADTVQQYSRQLQVLNREYSTQREELENLIHEYNVERRKAQSEFLELMNEMKATVTEKEWEKLAKFELKKLNPRTMSYSAGGH